MQSAYIYGHITETTLLRVQNDILQNVDNQSVTILLLDQSVTILLLDQSVTILLLDLSAAFDIVSHRISLHRLRGRIRVQGNALKCFESYLEDKKQAVCINGVISENRKLKFGIPQGLVLGPVLFSLYTLPRADILRGYGVEFCLFADDTQIYLSFQLTISQEDDVTKILHDWTTDIKNWMMENMLQLNLIKLNL